MNLTKYLLLHQLIHRQMDVFSFLVGLSLGLGLYLFQHSQRQRQLTQMLDSLAQGAAENTDLSLMSRLRSEIQHVREMQGQLEEKVATWRRVVETAPMGYLQVDEENQLLWCNECARDWLKINRWKPQEVRLLLELVRSYELDRAIEQTRRRQEPQVQEWVFQATPVSPTQGTSHAIALRAQTLPLERGQVGVFLENQQPLVDSIRLRDRAFSDLTHELRTPLTSISLVAQTLQSRLQGMERGWVERMLQETQRLIELIQNYLDIDRLEQNPRDRLNYESVPLKAFILEIWETLEPIARERELHLEYSGNDALQLRCDRAGLTQVFLNVLDNSIYYSPPQATLQIAVEQISTKSVSSSERLENKGWIIINIIDSGCGFQTSDLPHVFERLYRGDLSRSRALWGERADALFSRRGSGLGLS
ncbi:PAS domain-containing sensor histidine kinase, partial [Oscillatoria sp. FACHB-1406]|uniref:PAS domain-containing sensor histidine kinase n=1 Tax=Oscillatoria sp. FACHB-1406 TaxID=2692846 RepID=UPI001A7E6F7A